ncbi:hypothetical protein M8J77_020563 [Diaphorina citri]|nr:hypothetical protein M8J77_020563 [Diaphorina citri]
MNKLSSTILHSTSQLDLKFAFQSEAMFVFHLKSGGILSEPSQGCYGGMPGVDETICLDEVKEDRGGGEGKEEKKEMKEEQESKNQD